MELLFDLPTLSDRIRFVVAPLVERPRANVLGLVSRDLPAGARVEVLAESASRARVGWEMTIAIVRVVDDAGSEIERRHVAIYQVLWMVGAIMVIGSAAELERQRDLVDGVLSSGRPRLRGLEPACVAEWFDMEAA